MIKNSYHNLKKNFKQSGYVYGKEGFSQQPMQPYLALNNVYESAHSTVFSTECDSRDTDWHLYNKLHGVA